MTIRNRVILCTGVLFGGLIAQSGLEAMTAIDRPLLRAPLSTLPLELGDWVGRDEPVDPQIVEEAQTTDYLNRVYENRKYPGRRLWLWVNYSKMGTNMRHSPAICLPSGGWTILENETKVIPVPAGEGRTLPVTRLGYSRGESTQIVGFWYYIFGEGKLEQYVRRLPITSRSSHGRTTRGSGLTVEVFCPGEIDPDGASLRDFAGCLLPAIDPILPDQRANYYIP